MAGFFPDFDSPGIAAACQCKAEEPKIIGREGVWCQAIVHRHSRGIAAQSSQGTSEQLQCGRVIGSLFQSLACSFGCDFPVAACEGGLAFPNRI